MPPTPQLTTLFLADNQRRTFQAPMRRNFLSTYAELPFVESRLCSLNSGNQNSSNLSNSNNIIYESFITAIMGINGNYEFGLFDKQTGDVYLLRINDLMPLLSRIVFDSPEAAQRFAARFGVVIFENNFCIDCGRPEFNDISSDTILGSIQNLCRLELPRVVNAVLEHLNANSPNWSVLAPQNNPLHYVFNNPAHVRKPRLSFMQYDALSPHALSLLQRLSNPRLPKGQNFLPSHAFNSILAASSLQNFANISNSRRHSYLPDIFTPKISKKHSQDYDNDFEYFSSSFGISNSSKGELNQNFIQNQMADGVQPTSKVPATSKSIARNQIANNLRLFSKIQAANNSIIKRQIASDAKLHFKIQAVNNLITKIQIANNISMLGNSQNSLCILSKNAAPQSIQNMNLAMQGAKDVDEISSKNAKKENKQTATSISNQAIKMQTAAFESQSQASNAVRASASKIKAIIFDLDGVLCDSEALHLKTFNQIFSKYGVNISRQYWDTHYTGTGSEFIVNDLIEKYEITDSPQELLESRNMLFAKLLVKQKIRPIKGAKLIVNMARRKKIKLIVASSGHKNHVRRQLKAIGMQNIPFIALEDVKRKKPYPDCVIKALQVLGIKPKDALMIEDSQAGLKASNSAGVKCVLIGKSHDKKTRKTAAIWSSRLDAKKIFSYLFPSRT